MKFSVIITNHNYAAYLRESIDSALNQSRPPDEVIVVDDGSSDDSRQVLDQHYRSNPRIKILFQANLGQTKAIGAGIENATGDILCLLDADDRYKPNYLAELEAHYQARPHVDLTFCRFEAFGEEPYWNNDAVVLFSPSGDYDYGYTALLTYFGEVDWIGNVPATISLRAFLARNLRLNESIGILSMRTQGDISLLYAASLAGGRKYYLHKVLTEYRHHARMDTRPSSSVKKARDYTWWYGKRILIQFYKSRSAISDVMKWQLLDEAATVPDPLPQHLKLYRKVFLYSLLPEWLLTAIRGYKRKRLGIFGK